MVRLWTTRFVNPVSESQPVKNQSSSSHYRRWQRRASQKTVGYDWWLKRIWMPCLQSKTSALYNRTQEKPGRTVSNNSWKVVSIFFRSQWAWYGASDFSLKWVWDIAGLFSIVVFLMVQEYQPLVERCWKTFKGFLAEQLPSDRVDDKRKQGILQDLWRMHIAWFCAFGRRDSKLDKEAEGFVKSSPKIFVAYHCGHSSTSSRKR